MDGPSDGLQLPPQQQSTGGAGGSEGVREGAGGSEGRSGRE